MATTPVTPTPDGQPITAPPEIVPPQPDIDMPNPYPDSPPDTVPPMTSD